MFEIAHVFENFGFGHLEYIFRENTKRYVYSQRGSVRYFFEIAYKHCFFFEYPYQLAMKIMALDSFSSERHA